MHTRPDFADDGVRVVVFREADVEPAFGGLGDLIDGMPGPDFSEIDAPMPVFAAQVGKEFSNAFVVGEQQVYGIDTQPGPCAMGRFAPTYDESVTITLPCDNVVLSIGQCIQWGNLLDGEAVQLGRGQGAVADAMTYQTAQSDIFVGGDVYTGPRFAIDAIAAGKQGAISIHRFVQPNTSLTIGRNRRDFYELDKTNLALGDYDRAPRQAAGMDDAIDAHRSFRDAHLTLTEAQVKTETARCLGCGASVVDPNKCIGCGVCTTKCEFDAIHLHRDLPECSTMVRSEDKFKAILPYMAKREVKIRFGKKDK